VADATRTPSARNPAPNVRTFSTTSIDEALALVAGAAALGFNIILRNEWRRDPTDDTSTMCWLADVLIDPEDGDE